MPGKQAESRPRRKFVTKRMMIQLALDTEQLVEALADRWQVSQSQAINRVLREWQEITESAERV